MARLQKFTKLIRSTEFRLFLTFFIAYSMFANYINWNENSRIDLTVAIVDEGRLTIDSNYNNTGDRALYDGHYYTDKEPGMSFYAIPFYLIYKTMSGPPELPYGLNLEGLSSDFMDMMLIVISGTSALAGALSVVLLYVSLKYYTRRNRLLVAFAYGFGTLIFVYSRLFLNHAVAAFFSFLSFYLVLRMKHEKKDYLIWAGLSAGLAIMTQLSVLAIVAGIFIYLLVLKKRWWKFVLGAVIGLLPFLLYNFLIFGNPFDIAYFHMDTDIWGFESLDGQFEVRGLDAINIIIRLLIYPYRGIFFYSPILIISIYGLWRMRKTHRSEAVLIFGLLITFLIYNSQLNHWHGGSSFGPRHFVVLMPFLMIPLAYVSGRINRKLLYMLIAVSIFINLLGIQHISDKAYLHENSFNDNFHSIRPIASPLTRYFLPNFISEGPNSSLFENFIGMTFPPFVNLLILISIGGMIWHREIL